jgi:hypothetical protein
MALEAVVFPQAHLACTANKAMMSVAAHSASPACGIDIVDEFEDKGGIVLQEEAPHGGVGSAAAWNAALRPCSIAPGSVEELCWAERSVSPPPALAPEHCVKAAAPPASSRARRRKRPKAVKNQQEMESLRRNHIAVERNRRRQMNEYLAVLRSVMPPSYAQRVRTYASGRIVSS